MAHVQDVVGLVAGSGFAAGVNLYATVLLLGLYGRFLDAAAGVPELLTSTPVLTVAAVLTAIEFVADKIPWLDSAWDTVHTIIRPLGAAVLATVLVDDGAVLGEAAAGGLAGLLAFVSHSAKASTRVAVNASPEPFSNSIVSVLEDGLVAGLLYLAVAHPYIALGVTAVLAVIAIALVIVLWRMVRAWRRRRKARRGTRDMHRLHPR